MQNLLGLFRRIRQVGAGVYGLQSRPRVAIDSTGTSIVARQQQEVLHQLFAALHNGSRRGSGGALIVAVGVVAAATPRKKLGVNLQHGRDGFIVGLCVLFLLHFCQSSLGLFHGPPWFARRLPREQQRVVRGPRGLQQPLVVIAALVVFARRGHETVVDGLRALGRLQAADAGPGLQQAVVVLAGELQIRMSIIILLLFLLFHRPPFVDAPLEEPLAHATDPRGAQLGPGLQKVLDLGKIVRRQRTERNGTRVEQILRRLFEVAFQCGTGAAGRRSIGGGIRIMRV